MDVAKYIGLFLLKNHFCYIHGLGNLELRRKPASYDGTALQSPSYEVVVTPTGSIDDNLANFIATNEQISISKAANALRDFSTQSRTDLQGGKDVEIPNLGKFVEDNGKVFFVTHPNFQYTPPSIPSLRTGRRIEAERPDSHQISPQQQQQQTRSQQPAATPPPTYAPVPNANEEAGSAINWWRVILALIVLLVLISGGYYGFRYYKSHQHKDQPATSNLYPQDAPPADTAQKKDSTAAVVKTVDTLQSFDIIIDTYSSKKKADKRADAMKNYGHGDVQVVQDSTDYLVVIPVKCKPEDTTKIMDSLSRNYNPAGVSIFR